METDLIRLKKFRNTAHLLRMMSRINTKLIGIEPKISWLN
jgi:hypothetical protein